MQKTLPDNLLNLYDQSVKSSIDNYKKSEHNSIRDKNYQYYYNRSIAEINSINTTQLKVECLSIENQVNNRVKQLNQISQKLIESNTGTKNIGIFSLNHNSLGADCLASSSTSNSRAFSEKYSKDIQGLITQLKDLLLKIDNLSNSPFDSMKKAKSEYDNKCELILQPLINSMIEKRKFYNLVIKEKDSRLKIVEEKKTTLAENKMKIERLAKEFNENSEKMTDEMKQNEAIQREVEQLRSMNNRSQPLCNTISFPEDQLNIIKSMKKKHQIAMMNISEQLSLINYYQRNINESSRKFVYFLFKTYINLLLKKKHISLANECEANILKLKSDKEKVIKEYNDLIAAYLEAIESEEKQQQKMEKLNRRIKKMESISAVLQ